VEDALEGLLRSAGHGRGRAWKGLIAALGIAGIEASEEDLVELPLSIQLSDDLLSGLNGGDGRPANGPRAT
jgi:hypothetical protein